MGEDKVAELAIKRERRRYKKVNYCCFCVYFHQHESKALNCICPIDQFLRNIEFVNHVIQLLNEIYNMQ